MTTFAVVLGILMTVCFAAHATAAIPAQYVAKIYTEALGRIPDQPGWQSYTGYFAVNGCTVATLRDVGKSIYLSPEYGNLGYDEGARVLTAYRGVLSREPDSAGFTGWRNYLLAGGTLNGLLDSFYASGEFANLAQTICSGAPYFFGTMPVISIPVSGGGFQGDEYALQALLNDPNSGPTVFLAQKAVVRISRQLIIPPGKTLATVGFPDHTRYALMARLVRASIFPETVVRLDSGAALRNVWVDGQRGFLGPEFDPNQKRRSGNVEVRGGSGTAVINNRLSDPTGWTNLIAVGTAELFPCASNTIAQNLVTGYATSHAGTDMFADGLSIACENATVEGNQIVDATDVGIVLFRAKKDSTIFATQRSQVRFNSVLNAGNSAFGGVVVDHIEQPNVDFTGTLVTQNTVWSGPHAHVDVVLGVGAKSFPGSSAGYGTGAAVTNNSTGSQTVRANTGIGVSGMFNATVTGNNLATQLVATGISCPVQNIVKDPNWASGTIQGPFVQTPMIACVTTNHPN